MQATLRIGLVVLTLGLVGGGLLPGGGELPKMKFNEVREVAPGVFFRYSQISATDKSVVFGGSNNIWIVFEDYVLVYDANFPKEAGDVLAAIRKTTNKPIRYVLDSHHHGDHAYGNAVWVKEGATIVAQRHCADWLRTKGPKEFELAGKGPGGRKDIRESTLKVPSLVFDDKMVFDDGKQRAELYFFGHAHTPGDAFLYLPKHKVLCTGDACVNGAFNYTGHSDTASWIRVMERAQELDVKLICPGHGPVVGKDVLEKQRRYFIELRRQVQKGIDAGKEPADIAKGIDMPWYKEWTGVEASSRKENIDHVYAELTGKITPWDLVEDFGIYEGPSPTKDSPGWTRPKRIIVPNLMPARLAELKTVAPDVFFVPVKTAEEAAREAGDADAVIGFCTPAIVKAGKKLRWVQVGSAGVENYLFPEMVKSPIVLTNTQKMYGPNVADQALALLLTLSRGLVKNTHMPDLDPKSPKAADLARHWKDLKEGVKYDELHGKTILVVGLGGIGTQISRRAHGFGMRVLAIDPNDKLEKPLFVEGLRRPSELMNLLPKADVVVLACPLTAETRGMFGASQFAAMKPTAFFINIARGGIVKTPDLVEALKSKKIAGAGLDVTDPEPLPNDHPLWKLPNAVVSPHVGGQSDGARDRQWRLWRENVRRFVAGERLLCVVDKTKGY
jgi:phosphoglycerate dehydrogenase-like enzyme/glyoxylase-like metal-dependent hydrolase (beta-lactamase superfamily II)